MRHQLALTTGGLAKAAGVHAETLRFYERMELLPAPPRTPSGYRQYAPEAVGRIRFIKHAQGIGFSLPEIAELLELQFDPPAPCAEIERRALAKVDAIDQKVAELVAMQQSLLSLINQCRSDCTTACTVFRDPSDRERPAMARSPLLRSLSALLLVLSAAAFVVFGIIFAAFDVREALHQRDEARHGLLTLALIVAALHVGVALAAALVL